MKRLLKLLLRAGPVQAVLTWLVSVYIRAVGLTTRWEIHGQEHCEAAFAGPHPPIYCFWHGRLLLMPLFRPKGYTMAVMISLHRDGELIARTVAHFGFTFLRGSSSKGGSVALRAGLNTLRGGNPVSITPDGPRGPRMRVQRGAILMAKMSGSPLLPMAYSTTRGRFARSWDRFLISWPFSRGVMRYGPPLYVPQDADSATMERVRLELESRMIGLVNQVDAATRIGGVEPEAPS